MRKNPNKIIMPGLKFDTMYRALKDSLRNPISGLLKGDRAARMLGLVSLQ